VGLLQWGLLADGAVLFSLGCYLIFVAMYPENNRLTRIIFRWATQFTTFAERIFQPLEKSLVAPLEARGHKVRQPYLRWSSPPEGYLAILGIIFILMGLAVITLSRNPRPVLALYYRLRSFR